MTYGFGIVGCGMIAGFHAKAIKDAGGQFVACYDSLIESAERLAGQYGARPYNDLKTMLADPDVHVITIGTPSGAHLDPAIAAAEAGKHVIVEKPLEITLERCDKIIDACRRNNVKLGTIFPSRFHESSRQLKQAVTANRFGRLTMGDAIVKWYRKQEYYDSGAWRGTWELDGGGALMNQAIHTIDLLLWLMGPVKTITAHAALLAHKNIAVEDTAVATLQFANGALGIIEGSTAVYPGYLKRVEIHGSTGSAVIEEEDIIKWDFAEATANDAEVREKMLTQKSGGGGAADPAAIGHHGHALLFRNVLNAIENNTTPDIDGSEGRKSVEVILAIYLAAQTGKVVELPLKSDPELAARKNGMNEF
ncbi:MAG: Gfo/Idh/MocA family oxidoreductase [Planctomycetaceae bacterium]|jgi:predicted dehydrogenase|nr:Gfo/Idh/MocA family oxidoreductase [Planctomycetaceae bacterium]